VGEERLPLGSFDSIRQWANNWSKRGTDFAAVAQHSRKVTMKSISTKIGYDALAPDHQRIELPRAGEVYNLPVFSFVASFAAMLADPRLMREEFLQFSDPGKSNIMDPPPIRPKGFDFWYCDTNDGEYYRNSYKELIKEPTKQFLVTLMFFSDRTHTDRKARLTLEPLLFCPSSLFNLKARQNHQFWSLLGYLPYASLFDYENASDKLEDYHHALGLILDELHSLQHSNQPLFLDL
jgi:hypothetical protein